MTPRERFNAVIHFKKPDILPWTESFFDETITRWLGEGLPAEKVIAIGWEMTRGGTLLLNFPFIKGFDPYAYFGCQNLFGCMVSVDVGPLPRYKFRALRTDERYTEFQTETGALVRRSNKAKTWYAMPMFIDFPVKDHKTWEVYKKRLNPSDLRRYPKDWEKDSYIEVLENYQQGITLIRCTGFYGFGAELMGIKPFITTFYKNPELIQIMIEHWEYFTIESLRDAIETLKDRIDMVFWWEDMAERHGPCISPKLFKEFLLPHYKNVTSFLRKNKIDRIMMDSDGNMNPILDLIIEAGITGLWPLEVNSNMNAISIRKKYGNKLFLVGNLDKMKAVAGGETLKQEIDSKIPILKELGGFIPGLDHLVPVELTLKRFQEYSDYLKKYLPF